MAENMATASDPDAAEAEPRRDRQRGGVALLQKDDERVLKRRLARLRRVTENRQAPSRALDPRQQGDGIAERCLRILEAGARVQLIRGGAACSLRDAVLRVKLGLGHTVVGTAPRPRHESRPIRT